MKTQRLCRLLVSPNMPTAAGNFKNKKGRRNTISATSLSFDSSFILFLKKNVKKFYKKIYKLEYFMAEGAAARPSRLVSLKQAGISLPILPMVSKTSSTGIADFIPAIAI